MREIVFRGLTYGGEWKEGYLFRFGVGTEDEETYILGELDHRETIYDVWKCAEQVDPDTVGEWTGFYDLNGNRIYEGDIVERKVPRKYWSNRMYVDWCRGDFHLFDYNDNEDFLSNWCNAAYRNGEDIGGCYIIGNMIDNAYLMKGELND